MGWKSNTGAVTAALAQLLITFGVISPDMGEAIKVIGEALFGIGIAHKLERGLK
jgi:hypothetical protein